MRRLLIALLFLPVAAAAQDQPFEAAVSGQQRVGCFIIPIVDSRIQWFTPDRIESSPTIGPIATGDHERVFAIIQQNPPSVRVVQFEPDGTRTPFFEGLPGAFASAIAVAPNGRVLVTYDNPVNVAVISAAGALEATYPLPGAFQFPVISIGSDNCTLYYQKAGSVGRFDVCTGTALPDFVAGSFLDIEALPNGQVLLSSGDQVFLYDAAGTLVREVAELSDYGFGNNVAAAQIAINPDGSVLYVTASAGCDEEPNLLLTISFASGELLSNRPLAMNGPTSLVVGTLVNPANVPAAGTAALAFLAITLAFAAIWLLRR